MARNGLGKAWGITVVLMGMTLLMTQAPPLRAGPVIDGKVDPPAEWDSVAQLPDNQPTYEPSNPDYNLTFFRIEAGPAALLLRWEVQGTPTAQGPMGNIVNYAMQFDLDGDGTAEFWVTRCPTSIAGIGSTVVYAERNPWGLYPAVPTKVASTLGTFHLDSFALTPALEASIPYGALAELGYSLPMGTIRVLAVIDDSSTGNDDISAWETVTINVPEPATMGLLGLGLFGLGLRRKKK